MRVRDRQQGLQGGEDFSEANAEQNARMNLNETSSKSDTLFEFESDQSENHSPKIGLYSSSSVTKTNWTPEGVPIGQISLEETLEEELTSGVLESSSLSYIRSKANKLESAIREVNRECDTLIAVCDKPDKSTTVQPAYQPSDEMLHGKISNPANTTSKRMLVMASVALFATCGGVYAYVNPQNPINLAVHTKVTELASQPVIETFIKPSKNVYASLGGFAPSSQRFTAQVEIAAIQSAEPKRSAPVKSLPVKSLLVKDNLQKDKETRAVPVVNFTEMKITDAPIVREIIPQARQPIAPQFKISQANATDNVGLSERFGKGMTSGEKQPGVAILHNASISGTGNRIVDTSPRLAISSKNEIRLEVSAPMEPPKKRDKQAVERVVHQANARATLDNSQVKILVARLAQGDCLSSALHNIFGESKISPTFVHALFTGMENRC